MRYIDFQFVFRRSVESRDNWLSGYDTVHSVHNYVWILSCACRRLVERRDNCYSGYSTVHCVHNNYVGFAMYIQKARRAAIAAIAVWKPAIANMAPSSVSAFLAASA